MLLGFKCKEKQKWFMINYEDIKVGLAWVGLTAFGVITFFIKAIYKDHKEMYEFYTHHRELDIPRLIHEVGEIKTSISTLQLGLISIEKDSKRYWMEHKNAMESSNNMILERINHTNDNNKAAAEGIFDLLERIEKRIDRHDAIIDKHK